jgi:hypothetical protein
MLTYVDDFLMVAPIPLLESLAKAIQKIWRTNKPEIVVSQEECVVPEGFVGIKSLKFCGIEIVATKGGGLCIHQGSYLLAVLTKHDMIHVRHVRIIMDKNECMDEDDQDVADPLTSTEGIAQIRLAQKFIGELNWISQRTRPDITYSVSKAAQLATSNPWRAVAMCKRILRYLSSTRTLGIHFPSRGELAVLHEKSELGGLYDMQTLQCFTDASFAPTTEAKPDMKSHGGVIVMWGGSPLAWLSQKQPLITLSSSEAELVEGIEGHLYSLNVATLLEDLGCNPVRQLKMDNTSAI